MESDACELPIQPQTRHSYLSECVCPTRGGGHNMKLYIQRQHLSSLLFLSHLFLSVTHTHSPFSTPSKKMPKDRSKKMNRSQRLSWQQQTEATSYLDQQENLQSKPSCHRIYIANWWMIKILDKAWELFATQLGFFRKKNKQTKPNKLHLFSPHPNEATCSSKH